MKKEEIKNLKKREEIPAWKKMSGFFLRYLLPLAFTILLLIYLFNKVDFSQMLRLMEKGVNYWWILLAMFVSIFSHIFRAARWQIQLNALGIRPYFMTLCCSIFGCYSLNLVVPRLGELWRCTYISSNTKSSFSSIFGSMLGDRISDTIMVSSLLLLTLIVAAPALHVFLDKYPVGRGLVSLLSQFWFWCALVGGVVLMALIFIKLRHLPFFKKIISILREMWEGFTIITKMRGRTKFMILTLCIWGCYYFQLYIAFYAFDFTRALCLEPGSAAGLIPCLVAFVLSSISMAIPSNGGLGPWNIAIMFALAIYGIPDAEGSAFSMVVWGSETLILILLGIYTMIFITLSKKSKTNSIQIKTKRDDVFRPER